MGRGTRGTIAAAGHGHTEECKQSTHQARQGGAVCLCPNTPAHRAPRVPAAAAGLRAAASCGCGCRACAGREGAPPLNRLPTNAAECGHNPGMECSPRHRPSCQLPQAALETPCGAPVGDLVPDADRLLLLGRQRGHLARIQLGRQLVVRIVPRNNQVALRRGQGGCRWDKEGASQNLAAAANTRRLGLQQLPRRRAPAAA